MKLRFLVMLLVLGCMVEEPVPTPPPLFTLPSEDNNQVTIETPANVVEAIYRYAGPKNTITAASGWVVQLPNFKAVFVDDSSISYDLTPTGGTIVFNKPKPSVTVWVHGIPLHPELTKIVLVAPAKATLYCQEFGERTIDIDLSPEAKPGITGSALEPKVNPPEVVPPQKKRPIVYMWTMVPCPACDAANTAFAAHRPLPFDLIKDPNFRLPQMDNMSPWFGIAVEGKITALKGWPGYNAFMAVYNKATAARPQTVAQLAQYNGPRVAVSGMTVTYHLINHHGFTAVELAGYSEDQLYRIHSACHKEDDG